MPIRCCAAFLALVLAACSHGGGTRPPGPLRIVASTPVLASLARAVAGPGPSIASLVPIGASPEDYEPTPQDIVALRDADVLVENGANLESWLDATIRNAGNPQLRIVVCTDGLPVVNGNPHLWMDTVYAQAYVAKIRDALVAADPAHAADYRANTASYERQLVALTARIRTKIATIPPSRRAMIVFHDAFDYYARRFGLRLVGAIEPVAGAEPNPEHIAEIIRTARAIHVPAVFAEHEYSDKLARSLAASLGNVKIAFLYDDSLGAAPDVQTYIGMLDVDTDTIVANLR
jgi:ABC-type Zn uptake system ZnuABC Zn-binding protein ZnuA